MPTVHEHVDKIFCVDSKHWTDTYCEESSTDGSTEYLASFDKTVIITRYGYEYQKRQFVCTLCRLNDFPDLIILDSDEYVIGKWQTFKNNWQNAIKKDVDDLGIYKAQIQRLDAPYIWDWRPILWHNPWTIHYQNRHDYFKHDDDPSTYYISSNQNVEGIKINHDHSLRTPEHMTIRDHQLKWQQQVDIPL